MNTQQITFERLAGWAKKFEATDATPLVLIGIGQGRHSGTMVLCRPENGPSDAEMASLLHGVANQLLLTNPKP